MSNTNYPSDMSDGSDSEKDESTQYLKEASDSFVEASSNVSRTAEYTTKGIWRWFGNHPIIRWLVLLPSGYLITQGLLEFAGWFYVYFFGGNVIATRDIQVQTHPLPLGFSLNLLFLLWFVAVIIGYQRLIRLRQDIEELEETEVR